jgi:hypothetical protein
MQPDLTLKQSKTRITAYARSKDVLAYALLNSVAAF